MNAKQVLLLVGTLPLVMFGTPLPTSEARSGAPRQDVWRPPAKSPDAVKVLVVTGGHDHDADFYTVFDEGRINAVVEPHPAAFTKDIRGRADVLVLYDTARELEPAKQQNLRRFVEEGRGVVVLHHGICSNVNWPWWYEEVVGGRWLFEPVGGRRSSYRHDEVVDVRPVADHPITKGVGAFRIWDETYKDLWISPRAKVLLRTDNPHSDGPVAWIGPYEKGRIVYIQLGHDRNANLNPHYQRLVRNAIHWAAGKST